MNIDANPTPQRPHFRLGRIVATPGALAELERCGIDAGEFVTRHARGDWGDLDDEDKRLNDAAVAHEGNSELQSRVLSAYRLKSDDKLWIITEHDRSSTTILLASEY
jgi:hypothetical protein